jgi:hypothetical protein
MSKRNNTQPKRGRRDAAKQRLEAQLLRGTKPEKINGKTTEKLVALSDFDKKRINAEIAAINTPKK